MNKICQSCGMPMRKDPNQGGTNLDGSKNSSYCSYCWLNGKFVGSFTTAAQMQDFCIDKLKELGFPRFLGWIMTRNIPSLERWKTKP
jgi:hypothetical protein